jgi:hypothetical protein
MLARSTSVNTAPKPVVKPGVFVQGTKKFTLVIVLPIAVKSRGELNVVKRPGYVALMLPNSIGLPEAALALT